MPVATTKTPPCPPEPDTSTGMRHQSPIGHRCSAARPDSSEKRGLYLTGSGLNRAASPGMACDELRRIVQQLLEHEPAFQFSSEFETTDAESVILAPAPDALGSVGEVGAIATSPNAYERSLFDMPLLTFEQEQHYFRKLNYLKFRSTQMRHQLDVDFPVRELVQQIQRFDAEADCVRDLLVRANLRLVHSFARKYSRKTKVAFDDIRSEGHLALLRAVDCFNYRLGNRFSTYATWAIRNSAGRLSKTTFRDSERFVPVDPLVLREQVSSLPEAESEEQRDSRLLAVRELLEEILADLNERESMIIHERFGLNSEGASRTFRELAEEMGISRERVRQLQNQAIEQMRSALCEVETRGIESIFDH